MKILHLIVRQIESRCHRVEEVGSTDFGFRVHENVLGGTDFFVSVKGAKFLLKRTCVSIAPKFLTRWNRNPILLKVKLNFSEFKFDKNSTIL